MDDQTDTQGIALFLAEAKRLLSEGHYDFVPRRKNLQALARHGLTIIDAKNELFELTVADYYKGPKQDFDSNKPGDIWEFKKNVDGIPFYIKIKITTQDKEDILKCIGFHDDEYI